MTMKSSAIPTVIILDDDEATRDVVARYLKDAGLNAFPTGVQAEAIWAIVNTKGPRCAIIDVGMPKVTGLVVAQLIRAWHALDDCGIIFFTGFIQMPDPYKEAELMSDAEPRPGHIQRKAMVLSKPTDAEALLKAVKSMLL